MDLDLENQTNVNTKNFTAKLQKKKSSTKSNKKKITIDEKNAPKKTTKKINAALKEVGLQTGSVCIRFPDTFYLGAFSNPDEKLRDKAVSIAVDGCRWAADLGARDLIVWSPYDGYDYNFQVNYLETWKWTVEAFQKLADGCPQGKKKIGFFLDFFFSFFRCSFL